MSYDIPRESTAERRARLGRAEVSELQSVATRFYKVRERVNIELGEFERTIDRAIANATSKLSEDNDDGDDDTR